MTEESGDREGHSSYRDEAAEPMSSDELSDLARERRERAEKAASGPQPDFISNIEQTEVEYTFEVNAMPPLSQVNVPELTEALRVLCNVRLGPIDFSPLLRAGMTMEQLTDMPEEERMQSLMAGTGASLRFIEGRFQLRNDFVYIGVIRIDFESIYVSVRGHTSIAEAIAEDVFETLWRLAGSARRFADSKDRLQLVGYATGTRIRAPFIADRLLNPGLMEVLKGAVEGTSKYTQSIGSFKPSLLGKTHLVGVATLNRVVIRIAKFDTGSGRQSQTDLTFFVQARSEQGTGNMVVQSELKYEDHVDLIGEIIERLNQP